MRTLRLNLRYFFCDYIHPRNLLTEDAGFVLFVYTIPLQIAAPFIWH